MVGILEEADITEEETYRTSGNPNSAIRNRVASSNQSPKNASVSPNNSDNRSSGRMASSSSIYQVNPVKSPNNTIRNEVTKSELANPNSKTSSSRYKTPGRTQSTVNSRTKYESSTLSRAESPNKRYQAPVRSSSVNSNIEPTRSSSSARKTTTQQSTKSRSTSPNVRSSSSRSNNVSTPNRSSAPRYYQKNQSRTSPSRARTRQYSSPKRTSPNVSPRPSMPSSPAVRSGSSSRSKVAPSRSSSPSGSMSAPSRSSAPRSAPSSGSRGSSSPNRGGRR